MAFLGKLRSHRHYAAGTLRLQCLDQGASSSPAEDLNFAVKHLRKAVKLNPGFADAHHNLGNALIMGSEYNLAMFGMFPRGLNSREGRPQSESFAHVEATNEDAYSEALTALEIAVSLRHEFPVADNNLARALIKLGRVEDALRAFDIAIEQSPSYTKAIENRESLLKLLDAQ